MKKIASTVAMVRMRADYYLDLTQKKIPLAKNTSGIFGFPAVQLITDNLDDANDLRNVCDFASRFLQLSTRAVRQPNRREVILIAVTSKRELCITQIMVRTTQTLSETDCISLPVNFLDADNLVVRGNFVLSGG